MIQVAVMGYGTVGSGVVEVIEKIKKKSTKSQASRLTLNIYWIYGISPETLMRTKSLTMWRRF